MEDFNLKINDQQRKILPNKLVKYYDYIAELLDLNDMNIQDKAKISSSMHHSILTQYYAEQRLLNLLKQKRENIIQDEMERIKNNNNSVVTPKNPKPGFQLRNDAESADNVKKYDNKIEDQTLVVNWLYDALPILSRFGYTINNAKELIKLENA